jgi:phosphotransferase system HPr (HPr) family protein
VTIRNRLGLHARPAARFVTTANRFAAQIRVRKVGAAGDANAKSINQVATLGARQDDRIVISASGDDAEAALDGLVSLIESQFGEMEAEVEAVEAAGEPVVTAAAVAGRAAGDSRFAGPCGRPGPSLPARCCRRWRRARWTIPKASGGAFSAP